MRDRALYASRDDVLPTAGAAPRSFFFGVRLVKRVLLILAGLIVLLVAVALIAPSFIDWNKYKKEIAEPIERATGRTLAMNGDLSLSVLPTPRVSAADVRLSTAGGDADFLTLRALDVQVALWPLLRGEIQVISVRLVEPEFFLEVAADGTANWQFDTGASAPADDRAPRPRSASNGSSSPTAPSTTPTRQPAVSNESKPSPQPSRRMIWCKDPMPRRGGSRSATKPSGSIFLSARRGRTPPCRCAPNSNSNGVGRSSRFKGASRLSRPTPRSMPNSRSTVATFAKPSASSPRWSTAMPPW